MEERAEEAEGVHLSLLEEGLHEEIIRLDEWLDEWLENPGGDKRKEQGPDNPLAMGAQHQPPPSFP